MLTDHNPKKQALMLLLFEPDVNCLIAELDNILSDADIQELYRIIDERGRTALARLEQQRLKGAFYSKPF